MRSGAVLSVFGNSAVPFTVTETTRFAVLVATQLRNRAFSTAPIPRGQSSSSPPGKRSTAFRHESLAACPGSAYGSYVMS